MWAYVAAYKSPNDDPAEQARRVHVDYPIAIDRALGLGELPTVRLQHRLARVGPDGPRVADARQGAGLGALVVVHGAARRRSCTSCCAIRSASTGRRRLTYAVFDIGAMIYWVLPTAPPWYASVEEEHSQAHRMIEVRRMMVEYGESFWRDGWGPLYSVLGGNPLAAMPSLHFATSVMAALLLGESGPVAGAVGWAYASTLGFALVYLGEHYVADLLGGAALTIAVRRLAPRAAPAVSRCARAVAALEARAHGDGYDR